MSKLSESFVKCVNFLYIFLKLLIFLILLYNWRKLGLSNSTIIDWCRILKFKNAIRIEWGYKSCNTTQTNIVFNIWTLNSTNFKFCWHENFDKFKRTKASFENVLYWNSLFEIQNSEFSTIMDHNFQFKRTKLVFDCLSSSQRSFLPLCHKFSVTI